MKTPTAAAAPTEATTAPAAQRTQEPLEFFSFKVEVTVTGCEPEILPQGLKARKQSSEAYSIFLRMTWHIVESAQIIQFSIGISLNLWNEVCVKNFHQIFQLLFLVQFYLVVKHFFLFIEPFSQLKKSF